MSGHAHEVICLANSSDEDEDFFAEIDRIEAQVGDDDVSNGNRGAEKAGIGKATNGNLYHGKASIGQLTKDSEGTGVTSFGKATNGYRSVREAGVGNGTNRNNRMTGSVPKQPFNTTKALMFCPYVDCGMVIDSHSGLCSYCNRVADSSAASVFDEEKKQPSRGNGQNMVKSNESNGLNGGKEIPRLTGSLGKPINIVCTDPETDRQDQRKTKSQGQNSVFRSLNSISSDPKKVFSATVAQSPGVEPDIAAAKTFLFPSGEDYPVREYQLSIVETALMKNTLVVLPTGLGKTLIAAVVILNYLRWFKSGKVLFMAPTKPLVTQQVKACQNIVGIDAKVTARLMGDVPIKDRARFWQEKRLFFCTPQTVVSDLESNSVPIESIVLIVFDEAHRATGNYAFNEVIRTVDKRNLMYRVLALSATPGRDKSTIQQVLSNLKIAAIEHRQEDDRDVKKHMFHKTLDIVQVGLSQVCKGLVFDLNEMAEDTLASMRSIADCPSLFRKAAADLTHQMISAADAKTFNQDLNWRLVSLKSPLLFLLRCRQELMSGGLSSATALIDKALDGVASAHKGRRKLLESAPFKRFAEKARSLARDPSANPKLVKLQEILSEHFERHKAADQHTSCIVFASYRNTVAQITDYLERHSDLRVSPFVGQTSSKRSIQKSITDENCSNEGGSDPTCFLENSIALKGQPQKEQQKIVRRFRSGEIDVLISTCIGEEGLDIGSVDLIVCYDALGSPIRMVQRMGRAGRKRSGAVIVLVSEGREMNDYQSSVKRGEKIGRLLRTSRLNLDCRLSPIMLPKNVRPVCDLKVFHVPEFRSSQIVGSTQEKLKRREREKLQKKAAKGRIREQDVRSKQGWPPLCEDDLIRYRFCVDSADEVSSSLFCELQKSMKSACCRFPPKFCDSMTLGRRMQKLREFHCFIEGKEWKGSSLDIQSHLENAQAKDGNLSARMTDSDSSHGFSQRFDCPGNGELEDSEGGDYPEREIEHAENSPLDGVFTRPVIDNSSSVKLDSRTYPFECLSDTAKILQAASHENASCTTFEYESKHNLPLFEWDDDDKESLNAECVPLPPKCLPSSRNWILGRKGKVCAICGLASRNSFTLDTDSAFLVCSIEGCRVVVHQWCCGIRLDPCIDSSKWKCPPCERGVSIGGVFGSRYCILCTRSDGYFFCIQPDAFVHICCLRWNSRLGFLQEADGNVKELGIDNIMLNELNKQLCSICESASGLCVSCSHNECDNVFHASCALAHCLVSGSQIFCCDVCRSSKPTAFERCIDDNGPSSNSLNTRKHERSVLNENDDVSPRRLAGSYSATPTQTETPPIRARNFKRRKPNSDDITNTANKLDFGSLSSARNATSGSPIMIISESSESETCSFKSGKKTNKGSYKNPSIFVEHEASESSCASSDEEEDTSGDEKNVSGLIDDSTPNSESCGQNNTQSPNHRAMYNRMIMQDSPEVSDRLKQLVRVEQAFLEERRAQRKARKRNKEDHVWSRSPA